MPEVEETAREYGCPFKVGDLVERVEQPSGRFDVGRQARVTGFYTISSNMDAIKVEGDDQKMFWAYFKLVEENDA